MHSLWFNHQHRTETLTQEHACQLLRTLGYQPKVTSMQHLHAVQISTKATSTYEDERHLCHVDDLLSMDANTLQTLVASVFQATGYVAAHASPIFSQQGGV